MEEILKMYQHCYVFQEPSLCIFVYNLLRISEQKKMSQPENLQVFI